MRYVFVFLLFFATTFNQLDAAAGGNLGAAASVSSSLPARQHAVNDALAWLQTLQRPEGGIGGVGASCDLAWVVAQAGQDPAGPDWTRGGRSLLAVCEADTPAYLARRDAGRMGKVLRAVIAAGVDPRHFGGLDLITELEARYIPEIGLYDADFFFRQNLAILALHEAGRPLPAGVLPAVLSQQRPDGGWGWGADLTPEDGFSTPSDLDATVRTLQVLQTLALPSNHPAYVAGLNYLAQLQHTDGGWGLEDGPTNSNSTALAIEGILAAGWDPEGPRFRPQGLSPVQMLLSLQEASGAFIFRPGAEESRLMATFDAIPALLHPYPGDIATPFSVFLPLSLHTS